jgi:hypothetical protein
MDGERCSRGFQAAFAKANAAEPDLWAMTWSRSKSRIFRETARINRATPSEEGRVDDFEWMTRHDKSGGHYLGPKTQ